MMTQVPVPEMDQKEPAGYYEALGVSAGASAGEIKQAFRRQVKYLHPDRNESEGAREAFQRLLKAYEVLGDPARRAEYDGAIFLREFHHEEGLGRVKKPWGDPGRPDHWVPPVESRWRWLWRHPAFQGIFVVGISLLIGGLLGRGKPTFNNDIDTNSHWSNNLDVAKNMESVEMAGQSQPAEPPERKDESPDDLWYVTATSLRVRAGPGKGYRVQGVVKQFDTLEVSDAVQTGDWVAVRIGPDLKGFVLREYITRGDGRLARQRRGEDRESRPKAGTSSVQPKPGG